MRCSFMATLMSPLTLNLPIMKPVAGSSSPLSSGARFLSVMAMVQSASLFSLLTVLGMLLPSM